MNAYVKQFACVLCDASVNVLAETTTHLRCPEFYRPPEGAWIGSVWGEDDDQRTLHLVCVCSKECLDTLLEQALAYENTIS